MAYWVNLSVDSQYRPVFVWLDQPRGFHGLQTGKTVSPEIIPAKAVQKSNHKHIPDFIPLGSAWGVCEDFKDMIEAREPGLHQFFPIELIRKSGEPSEKTYYLLNIRQRIDAVIPELSDVYWTTTEVMKARVLHLQGPNIVVQKDLIEGRHLWRGDSQLTGYVFFSDDLMKAVMGKPLMAIVGQPLDEVACSPFRLMIGRWLSGWRR